MLLVVGVAELVEMTLGTLLLNEQLPAPPQTRCRVYRAYDPTRDKTVVVKLLAAEALDHARLAERFLRMGQILSGLRHPHLVEVALGDDMRSAPYIVMPFLTGGSLDDWLSGPGIPGVDLVMRILGELAAALDYLHAQQIVHAALSPANVLFNSDGRAMLSDAGIAAIAGREDTSRYRAPEQHQQADTGPWTDVYALGALATTLAGGVLANHPPADALAELLQSARDPDPLKRPVSASAFVESFRVAFATHLATAHTPSLHPTAPAFDWSAIAGSPAPEVALPPGFDWDAIACESGQPAAPERPEPGLLDGVPAWLAPVEADDPPAVASVPAARSLRQPPWLSQPEAGPALVSHPRVAPAPAPAPQLVVPAPVARQALPSCQLVIAPDITIDVPTAGMNIDRFTLWLKLPESLRRRQQWLERLGRSTLLAVSTAPHCRFVPGGEGWWVQVFRPVFVLRDGQAYPVAGERFLVEPSMCLQLGARGWTIEVVLGPGRQRSVAEL